MNKSDQIRSMPASMPTDEVADTVGASKSLVRRVRASLGATKNPRGRPRKSVHPAEACARFLESLAGALDISGYMKEAVALKGCAQEIRAGRWKEYL